MSEKPPADLVLFSDLHLGEGYQARLGRFSPMEDFFHDEAFARLIDSLRERYSDNPSRMALVFNGDIFDFLTVTSYPDPNTCRERGFEMSETEKKFGLNPTPSKSVYKLDTIIAGHQPFFGAVARLVAAGHRLEILRGNHDVELFFRDVRARFREHLTGFEGGPSPEEAQKRVRFHQWFYLEPKRLYIEHGNQYEASNSIRYPLRPLVPKRKWENNEPMLDYPLGSMFVRYYYNRIHHLNPYTPKVISFEQYLEFIRRYNLLDLLRVARDHYPFFMAALRPQAPRGSSRPTSKGDAKQEADFETLEETTEPADLYRYVDKLKVHPLAASKLALAKGMMNPVLKRILYTGGVTFVVLFVWTLIFNVIQDEWLVESVFARAFLLLFFTLVTLVGLLWIGNYIGQRLRRQTDITVETCAERADLIARHTGVKLVLMGHTHVVDIRRVADGQAVYANSGTWVSVDNPWNRLVPAARRLTFLYVMGDDVQVCRWNDDAGRIDRVPLFNLTEDQARERCPAPVPQRPVEPVPRTWRRGAAFEEKDPDD